jgi:2-polyprenyl-3-methyl-5-hydroxy-6-metoxy-1,4-benzoquinol methylase
MSSLDLVRSYFGREAARFDAIYEQDKPLHQRLGDAIFRRVILERFSLVVNAAAAAGRTVLDVGTGPGRYPIELARRGARRATGVDVADEMIAIAKREAERAGVAEHTEWHVGDFLTWTPSPPDLRWDVVIAMGYFDYMEDPRPHLGKMIEHARGQVFASFPKRWEVRVPLRKARFALAGGFVRFYSRAEVLALFASVGALPYLSLVDLGRDYVAVYDAAAAEAARGAGANGHKHDHAREHGHSHAHG